MSPRNLSGSRHAESPRPTAQSRAASRRPAVIVSRPGTQRALAAVEDCTYLTVHRTEETDLDAVEADLVEPDPTSPFGVGNKLKSLEHQSWPS